MLQRLDSAGLDSALFPDDKTGSPVSPSVSIASSGFFQPSEAALLEQTQKFVYPGGGVVFRPFVEHIASELYHVQPWVHGDDKCVVVVFGHISNLPDLIRQRKLRSSKAQDDGKVQDKAPETGAETILDLYLDTAPGDELLLLSSLQGQYAIVIYDNTRRQIFAARDPSGAQQLYFNFDNAVTLTNDPAKLPASLALGSSPWLELPPGHYITGKKVGQFALTPEQMSLKEQNVHSDDDWNMLSVASIQAQRVW